MRFLIQIVADSLTQIAALQTKTYVAKRVAEGHSKLEAIRALKRYIAREVFTLIMRRHKTINQTQIAA